MTDKTLPERMREAADVLEEANAEGKRRDYAPGPHDGWNVLGLRMRADEWEREDAEKAAATAKHDAEVEELAEALYRAWWGDAEGLTEEQANVYRRRARNLIAAGWTKQTREG